ncbi:MAG TPA: MBL fold metallo-hydrolase [Candidatus Sphingobacterium stercoripullorum]|uniref:MBL fold metallo-hydrolase n=1 Tax=Candidatus Sphingobacterium stercoripullorum TaxID=2838759 RepID=A0A9D1W7V2_9SPHI|nr:MBL fold metallo-hydrolase [Candidatus Sphingobacterium stercoripullorum]
MEYAAIASGSNGNCYYVGDDEDAILIDIGVSCRRVEQRSLEMGLDLSKVRAVFVTHEHGDHISGLRVFVKKHKIPVYLTEGTYKGSRLQLKEEYVNLIDTRKKQVVGSMEIIPVVKNHDAQEPCSFIVKKDEVQIAVLTDIGCVCSNVARVLTQSQVVFLEANYDEQMLDTGGYPYYLKERIRGGQGHLSNQQALQALLNHGSSNLKHVILSHLSANNNSMELVESVFEEYGRSKQVEVTVCNRDSAGEVFSFSYNVNDTLVGD